MILIRMFFQDCGFGLKFRVQAGVLCFRNDGRDDDALAWPHESRESRGRRDTGAAGRGSGHGWRLCLVSFFDRSLAARGELEGATASAATAATAANAAN